MAMERSRGGRGAEDGLQNREREVTAGMHCCNRGPSRPADPVAVTGDSGRFRPDTSAGLPDAPAVGLHLSTGVHVEIWSNVSEIDKDRTLYICGLKSSAGNYA